MPCVLNFPQQIFSLPLWRPACLELDLIRMHSLRDSIGSGSRCSSDFGRGAQTSGDLNITLAAQVMVIGKSILPDLTTKLSKTIVPPFRCACHLKPRTRLTLVGKANRLCLLFCSSELLIEQRDFTTAEEIS